MFFSGRRTGWWNQPIGLQIGATHDFRTNEHIDVDDLIRRSGFQSRYIKYLLGAALLAAVTGFALPTESVPYFDPGLYSQGGVKRSGYIGAPQSGAYIVFFHLLGWVFLAGWADIIGRRELVSHGLNGCSLLALSIAFLPQDVSMAAAVALYYFISPTWICNASLMQSETVQPLNVLIPISVIKLLGSLLSASVWFGGWSILSNSVAPVGMPTDGSDVDNARLDFNQRVKFLLCGILLVLGNCFIRFLAFESPHYLILQKDQKAALQALEKLCNDQRFSQAPQKNVVLALQDTDISAHYLHLPTMGRRLRAHFKEFLAFLQLEEELLAYDRRSFTRRQSSSEASNYLDSSMGREETPRSHWNNDLSSRDDLTAVTQPARLPHIFSFANKQNCSDDAVITEHYDDDLDHLPMMDRRKRPDSPTAASLLSLVALASALGLSVEGWAGRFWSQSLDNPAVDLHRLLVDAGGVVGAILTIVLTRFFEKESFYQFRVLLRVILGALGALVALHTFEYLSAPMRLSFALVIPCAVGMAQSAAVGILIDHVPLTLRATVMASTQAMSLILYVIAHGFEQLLLTMVELEDHDCWLLPLIWLLTCLSICALFTNLLWPQQ